MATLETAKPTGPSFSLRNILQKHEEQLIDFDKNVCLLCKRVLKNGDHMRRHRTLSELHSSRLKRLRQRIFSEEQLEKIEKKEREALYRDRAKERRLKFGNADKLMTTNEALQANEEIEIKPDKTEKPIGKDNKGAALLAKMGWKEGTGLGKNNEGITDIIKLDSQVGTSGLGSRGPKVNPNLSYKEAVKQFMYQRYHELSSDEESANK